MRMRRGALEYLRHKQDAAWKDREEDAPRTTEAELRAFHREQVKWLHDNRHLGGSREQLARHVRQWREYHTASIERSNNGWT